MGPVYLFDIASQQARWLGVRQQTLAGNIANVNTPGFKAKDVVPFADVLDHTQFQLATTNAAHMSPTGSGAATPAVEESESWEQVGSGNSVSVEQELMKAGDVNRAYSLNTGIVKSFNRMILASVKSGS